MAQIPLVVVTTATGQSIECDLCDWVEPIAIGTGVPGYTAILRDHYEEKHPTYL
jgi:hypothetical protein